MYRSSGGGRDTESPFFSFSSFDAQSNAAAALSWSACAAPAAIMNPSNVPRPTSSANPHDGFGYMHAARGYNSFSNSNGSSNADNSSFSFPRATSGPASSSLNPILNTSTAVPTRNGSNIAPTSIHASSESERSDSEEPAASTSRTNGKRKASATSTRDAQDGSSVAGDGPPRTKKKRNRAVLSCVPCKARSVSPQGSGV